MGNCTAKELKSEADGYSGNNTSAVMAIQGELAASIRIPLMIQVAHFTPSSFPLLPIVNPKNNKLCESTWNVIVANSISDEYGGAISGMTVFYNEFYERLDALDSNGRYDAILSRNSSGNNKIAAKGAILIRIINFVLKIESNNKQTQMVLYMLGKSHSQRGIRPWQYSTFIQTLLLTISSRLGTSATNNVMEAWVNLFAFVMQSMLPPAIKDQVVETELNINTSSEFAGGRVAEEVAELEEVNEMRRKMKAGTHSQGSRSVGGRERDRERDSYEQQQHQQPQRTGSDSARVRGGGGGGGAVASLNLGTSLVKSIVVQRGGSGPGDDCGSVTSNHTQDLYAGGGGGGAGAGRGAAADNNVKKNIL